MRTITVVEAKSRFSALLAEVEAGEEIAVTRHGKVVARLVPDRPRVAADAFRDFWSDGDIDLCAPDDPQAEKVESLTSSRWRRSTFWIPTSSSLP